MQILLLLSALLSAVTGAFAGPRAVEAPVSQAEVQPAAAVRAAARVQVPTRLPVQDVGRARVETDFVFHAPAALRADAPLAKVRLIE